MFIVEVPKEILISESKFTSMFSKESVFPMEKRESVPFRFAVHRPPIKR